MSIKALQEYTYYSKYARYNKAAKRRETWSEAIDRVKNMHLVKYADRIALYPEIEEKINWAFEVVRQKRVLGSQRALQFGGKPILKKNARLYNCCTSYCDRIRFFQEAFWLLLCGCGTGFSVQKHHVAKLPEFTKVNFKSKKVFLIPDSIEGWSDALGVLLASYFPHPDFPQYIGCRVEFDFSLIRSAGSIISSGTGKAPGPEPLCRSLEIIRELLDKCLASGCRKLRPIDAYDIVMHISDAVLSGGVRRSATICLFSPDDKEMATAKTGNWLEENPQRGRSNNSALLVRNKTSKEEFLSLMENVKQFGEPGFIWADSTELVVNPCVEVGMWPVDEKTGESGWQMCNLCEINGKKIKSKEDWAIAAKAGAIVGTLQAGYTDFDYLGPITKRIVERESLLGVSLTGMMDNPQILFDTVLQGEMALLIVDVNNSMAKLLGINPSARLTCVKPAGCQHKDTILITENGILSLEEIGDIDGDIWQEYNSKVMDGQNFKNSNNFFINGNSKTKKITMQSGIILECTLNHKFKVFEHGKLIWKMAKEINSGDMIPYFVGGYNNTKDPSLFKISIDHFKIKKIKQPDCLNEELCWLLGLYLGDGSNHKKGIRIAGNKNDPEILIKAKHIIKNVFDWDCQIVNDNRPGNRQTLYFNSQEILLWLKTNDLLKNKSFQIRIPKIIRQASVNCLNSYLDGYWNADGCLHPVNKTRNWVTTSPKVAHQLPCCLRAIGIDASVRLFPPTKKSKGKRMRYWIQEKKGRNGNYKKSPSSYGFQLLDEAKLSHLTPDYVELVEDSENYTYDVEVPDGNTYVANSYISHNTTSCVLGTGSGIHPHHAKRYFRRTQGNIMEVPLQHFKKFNPHAVEKSVWSANGTDEVVTFCVEVEDGVKTKCDLDAVSLLEYVKLTQQNWVTHGCVKERCTQPWLMHNVSNTINVRPDEWTKVANFIYENRQYFAGISLLPQSGDLDYPQAPMTIIHTSREIIQIYGDGALMASGLIVDGLHAFDNNLWNACDYVLGIKELQKPEHPGNTNFKANVDFVNKKEEYQLQIDWIRRVEQFAERYCENDVRRCTYLMKEVNNWKLWLDLRREYKDVDYTTMIEEEDNTKPMETIACAGGLCSI